MMYTLLCYGWETAHSLLNTSERAADQLKNGEYLETVVLHADLLPPHTAVTLRYEGRQSIDEPTVGTKEELLRIAVVEVDGLEEAVSAAARMLSIWPGITACEVRPILTIDFGRRIPLLLAAG